MSFARSRMVLLAAIVFLCAPSIALAQANPSLVISLSPTYPHPGEAVTLTLSGSLHDLPSSPIRWTSGGTVIAEGTGVRSATITLGPLGSSVNVRAIVSSENGDAEAAISITPGDVHLLWESDSYAPSVYRGRLLPSAGTQVRLLAIPYLPRPGGGLYAAADLTYTWKINGATLPTHSGRGKSSATIHAPELFGSYTVSVEVAAQNRAQTAEGRARIASVEPVLRLYEDHPLFGMQLWSALPASAFIAEREMTFAAIPYFADATSPDDPLLNYAWRVDGRALLADEERPSAITLSAEDSGAVAALDLTLTHVRNLLQEARGVWSITLLAGTDAGVFDSLFGQ